MTIPGPQADGRAAKVLVPIVPAGGERVVSPMSLLSIVAGDTPHCAAPEQVSQDIAGLGRELRLAGRKAKDAAYALKLTPPRWWLWRRGTGVPLTPMLRAEDADFGKGAVQEENARSAELGIALALLLSLTCRGGAIGTVIATGALSPPKADSGEAAVEPVALIETKLDLILRQLEGVSGPHNKIAGPGHLFLPVEELMRDGGRRGVAQTHADALGKIAAHGFAIHYVRSLRQAADILGAVRLPMEPWQVWSNVAAAALISAVAAFGGYRYYDRVHDLPLDWAAVEGRVAPLRAAHDGDGFRPLPPCVAPSDGRLALRAGESLLLKAVVPGGRFDDLAYAVLWADGGGGVKVWTGDMAGKGRIGSDGALNFALTAENPPGRGVVGVTARRLSAFDQQELMTRVRKAMQAAPDAGRLNAAEGVMRAVAPGFLAIPIEVLPSGDPACRDG